VAEDGHAGQGAVHRHRFTGTNQTAAASTPDRADPIIELRQLRKTYRRRGAADLVAVDDLTLRLGHAGTVHGLLGPNGSGKTTTIRCLLGLIRPTRGTATVFGADASREFHRVAHRVGALVENPKMFPNFSARKNLSLLARLGGIAQSEVDRVLDVVGLAGREHDSFAAYSLGMKQRLAIAAALLKDPDLLVLDEPASGLDPAGIAEMRRLIRQIADDGRAVIVSSHQLVEMEQVCDDVTIINGGRLVETGSLNQIQNFAGSDRLLATIDDREAAISVLAGAGIMAHPRPDPQEMVVDFDVGRSADVNRVLAENGLYLSGLRSERATLESAFLNLTEEPPPPEPNPGRTPAQPDPERARATRSGP